MSLILFRPRRPARRVQLYEEREREWTPFQGHFPCLLRRQKPTCRCEQYYHIITSRRIVVSLQYLGIECVIFNEYTVCMLQGANSRKSSQKETTVVIIVI